MPIRDPEKRRENSRRYYEANRERRLEYRRRYAEANPDRVREGKRRWQEANPDRVREISRRYRATNPDRVRERTQLYVLRKHHGMRPEDWAAMWDAQHGLCYLCGDPLHADAHIDHDHICCPPLRSCGYCRRGLACNNCNTAIGLALDDPDRLRRMADNLEAEKQAAAARLATKPRQLTLGDTG